MHSDAHEAGDRAWRARPWALPFAVVATVAAALFLQTRGFGLIGCDSYPVIAASRAGSLGEWFGLFGESLMQGYYPSVFYRPLFELSVALDHALWGLDAAGYQLTNVLVFAAASLAIFALARRSNGPGAPVAAWVALLAFMLHPLQYDVVPLLPRRSEALCCAFIAVALWLQISQRALAARFPLWPAVAGAAAMASKETGFVLPLVSFVAVALYVEARSWPGRLARAATAVVPHAVAAIALLALRAAALPGPGLLATLRRDFGGGGALPPGLSGSLLEASPIEDWVVTTFFNCLLVGVVLAAFGWAWPGRDGAGRPSREALRAEVVAAVLVAAVLALTAGRTNPWHLEYLLYIPMAGSALLTAAVVVRTLRFARAAGVGGRVGAAAMLLLLATPWLAQARYSPLFFHYGEGEAATAASRAFFTQARARIEQAPLGSVVEGPLLPRRVPPRDPLRRLGTTVLLDYSVQAWADLTLPERKVRVVFDPDPAPGRIAAGPDEVVLWLSRPQPGF